MKKNIYLLLCLIVSANLFAQHSNTDSLKQVVKTEKDDTDKVNNLISLGNSAIRKAMYDTALQYGTQALSLSEKLNYDNGIANASHTVGVVYASKYNYAKATDYFNRSIAIDEKRGDKKGIEGNLANMGIMHLDQGDYPAALDYFLKTRAIAEAMGDKKGLARLGITIGIVYEYENDSANALNSYRKAIDIYTELKDKEGISVLYGNMGIIYMNNKMYTKALDYYQKSLAIKKVIGYKVGIEKDYLNIGSAYMDMAQYDSAMYYFRNGYNMSIELSDKDDMVRNGGNMGAVYFKQKKYPEAEETLKKSIALADSIHDLEPMKEMEKSLGELYAAMGKWQDAYKAYDKYSVLKDSLNNQGKSKEIGRLEAKADFDKTLAVKQVEENERIAVDEAEKKKQRAMLAFAVAIALGVAIIAVIIFRSLRVTRKQKALIEKQKLVVEEQKQMVEEQKAIVEEKNKDILDSITYAKRLQDAILPPMLTIKKYLPESFVLYKPKDIVAGDFYWMERVDDVILIAACDCTGHGVPGAMVSVVCSNALNRALNEFKLRDTGKMLDKVRELVLETFVKSEGEVKDGMDCSFCAINTKTNQVEWSGAYNPLWYIQNGEMKEVTADKQPIGKTDNPVSFSAHTLKLAKGDSLYLFTDGFADQFGGPKGKKFKYKQLQQLILDNAKLAMEAQGKVLNETIEAWKGNLEQVDDVLIIGIRV